MLRFWCTTESGAPGVSFIETSDAIAGDNHRQVRPGGPADCVNHRDVGEHQRWRFLIGCLLGTMSAGQLEKFARFLKTHHGFYPELMAENAMICGFRVGGCFLSVAEMSEFISAQPSLAAHEAALRVVTDKRPTVA